MSKSNQMPDTILAVSVECTCWERPKDQPAGHNVEVIEIGIVPVSTFKLTIGDPKSIIVKPITSKVSKFCTSITTLTQEQVNAGIYFKDACEKLVEEHDTQKTPWVSFGEFDKKQLVWQCQNTETKYPFGAGFTDWRYSFARLMGLEHDVGLDAAMKLLGLDFIGTRHRGADEAFNIARLMVECYKRIRGINGKEAA